MSGSRPAAVELLLVAVVVAPGVEALASMAAESVAGELEVLVVAVAEFPRCSPVPGLAQCQCPCRRHHDRRCGFRPSCQPQPSPEPFLLLLRTLAGARHWRFG